MNKKIVRTLTGYALIIIVAAAAVFWAASQVKRFFTIAAVDKTEVAMSETQINSIRDIGQWEFLAIDNEELVDTMRRGFFSNDHLVRIYYGTLRLGIDLSDFTEDDAELNDSTLTLHLSDAKLLDEHFIDEARTKSFHESGTWSNKARQELYDRACARMKKRCVTQNTLKHTRELAQSNLTKLLKNMGFKQVVITFDKPQPR